MRITAHTNPQGRFSSWWINRAHLVLTGGKRKARLNPQDDVFAIFSASRHCVGHVPKRDIGQVIVFLQTGIPPEKQLDRPKIGVDKTIGLRVTP